MQKIAQAAMKPTLGLVVHLLPVSLVQGQTITSSNLSLDTIPLRYLANEFTPFDHEQCIDRILNYTTATNESPIPTSKIFVTDDDTKQPFSTRKKMIIWMPACKKFCSRGARIPFRDWYPDSGPRIMAWIVPVALLLSSIELSPLDKRRFHTLFQAVGDPIDVLWSLIHKLQMRHQLHALATSFTEYQYHARIMAIVLGGFEDLLSPNIESYQLVEEIKDFLLWDAEKPGIVALWEETAVELVDGRTDERLRSLFAISLYILQILSNFIGDIGGGSPNPPGGVIAAALTLTFLIPMVLLSAVLGAPTSRRNTLRTLNRFVQNVEAFRVQNNLVRPPSVAKLALLLRARGILLGDEERRLFPWDVYFKSLHTDGGKDTYRPWKMRALKRQDDEVPPHDANLVPLQNFNPPSPHQNTSPSLINTYRHQPHHFLPALLATFSVLAGLIAGTGLLLLAGEGGFSCRHILFLAMLAAWLLSALLTSLLYLPLRTAKLRLHQERYRRWHWRLCLFKGIVIGVAVLVLLALTGAGFFNTCACWGRYIYPSDPFGKGEGMGKGEDSAMVELTVNERYKESLVWRFPAIMAGAVAFQLLFAVGVLYRYRNGVRAMRWSERRRQAAWRSVKPPLGRRERPPAALWAVKTLVGMMLGRPDLIRDS